MKELIYLMVPKIWPLHCQQTLCCMRQSLGNFVGKKKKFSSSFSFPQRTVSLSLTGTHVTFIHTPLNCSYWRLYFTSRACLSWKVLLLSIIWSKCCNSFSLWLGLSLSLSLSFSHILQTLASISDASLELCVMPKDEDILQLVSTHSPLMQVNNKHVKTLFAVLMLVQCPFLD